MSTTEISSKDARVHGLSAIEVFEQGSKFLALSDRGTFIEGRIERQQGRIKTIDIESVHPVLQVNGEPTNGFTADSEGLAIDQSNRIYVSFEGFHRVRAHSSIEASAKQLPTHPAFKGLQSNSGLEALAVDDLGRLYAIPERSGHMEKPFPVYRYGNGKWTEIGGIPRRGSYLMVGADFGPNGRLYVLERDFSFVGFQTRIRRFELKDDLFQDEETVLETRLGTHDNLEGISIWQNENNETIVTLISDDNFIALLDSHIVEYVLVE